MGRKLKSITVVPQPSWGKVLEMFQAEGNVMLLETDAPIFRNILAASTIPYSEEEVVRGKLTLRKFTLKEEEIVTVTIKYNPPIPYILGGTPEDFFRPEDFTPKTTYSKTVKLQVQSIWKHL